MTHFTPSRTAAIAKLADFVPKAGRDYARLRNFDMGAGHHTHVSGLSPYLRHRVITETEVLQAVLGRHSPQAAEKFVQEVFWRTYWKGWLEMRPGIWHAYQIETRQALDHLHTQGGLQTKWKDACTGNTGLACFDNWAHELVQTGYLHNHARMWFASVWIFTLGLPWQLGADFFLRHLLDGDPASNTLGWRWVAGLQTKGKTYLARPSNIETYTQGRFAPANDELAHQAVALNGPPDPDRGPLPVTGSWDPSKPTGVIIHDDDLALSALLDHCPNVVGTACLQVTDRLSPLRMSPLVQNFKTALMDDTLSRWSKHLGPIHHQIADADGLTKWAKSIDAEQVLCLYAPVGPANDVLRSIPDLPVHHILRQYDADAWPYATAGFFKFRKQIPSLLGHMRGIRAA